MTIKVGDVGVIHLPDYFVPALGEPTPNVDDDSTNLAPKGGVVLDGYLTTQDVNVGGSVVAVPVLDRFAPNAATILAIGSTGSRRMSTGSSPWKPPSDMTVFHTVPYLHIPVPEQWESQYNNPVQPPPGSTVIPKVYSQYRLMKPTMYSGFMRVIAQLIMGYGRKSQPTKDIQIDRHVFTVAGSKTCWCGEIHYKVSATHPLDPNKVYRAMEDYSFESSSVPEDDKLLGSLNYSFSWAKTHGVYKTDAGRLYLIRISADGMFAMRMPVLGNTQSFVPTSLSDMLKDMPLGYDLPSGTYTPAVSGQPYTPASAIDSAVLEGWVKRLLTPEQLAPFYTNRNATYTECGWAFSASGKKIDNVCWHIPLPKPYDYPYFEHYHIEITGGDGGTSHQYNYAHCTNGYDGSISSLSASISKVGEGNALDISQYSKPFKVPMIDQETGIPAVISFDMLPRGWSTSGPPEPVYLAAVKTYPVSDTTVHVFYDDEELIWIRFFNPMNTAKTVQDSWDDRTEEAYPHECMILGSYTWGSTSRSTALPRGFYSNRIDPRQMADESSVDMRSSGEKTWESPYMGITYSYPYPPRLFGYQDSNGYQHGADYQLGYDDFEPGYNSAVGSPWTGKRHCFHVHVTGLSIVGQQYVYSCALPLTDREAAFICERRVQATKTVFDNKYAAMVMQFVYYTFPSWIPDLQDSIDGDFGIPVGNWEDWQLRYDTVKYLRYQLYPIIDNYTKEPLRNVRETLNIAGGWFEAPTDIWNHDVTTHEPDVYTISSICSTKFGAEYPSTMLGVAGSEQLWEWLLPWPDGWQCAWFWATRSVVGTDSSKQNIYINGGMDYTGLKKDKMSLFEITSLQRQVTFLGDL